MSFHGGIAPESRTEVEIGYQARLLEELDEICAAIAHPRLAIQWDCAHDVQAFDGAPKPWFEPAKQGIVDRLVTLGNRVPPGVELGYHWCYGSFGGKHFVEPKDAGAMVELTNAVQDGLARSLKFIHMPVPVERSDEAYFAPLAKMRLHADTEVYLGLIHDIDGVDGAHRRIAAAKRYIGEFGLATECVFGRRPAASAQGLIDLHANVVATGQ